MIPPRLEPRRQQLAVDAEDHQRRDADGQIAKVGDDFHHEFGSAIGGEQGPDEPV